MDNDDNNTIMLRFIIFYKTRYANYITYCIRCAETCGDTRLRERSDVAGRRLRRRMRRTIGTVRL